MRKEKNKMMPGYMLHVPRGKRPVVKSRIENVHSDFRGMYVRRQYVNEYDMYDDNCRKISFDRISA